MPSCLAATAEANSFGDISAAEAAAAANAVSAASAVDWTGRQNAFGLLLASEQSLFDFIDLMFSGYLRLVAPTPWTT